MIIILNDVDIKSKELINTMSYLVKRGKGPSGGTLLNGS